MRTLIQNSSGSGFGVISVTFIQALSFLMWVFTCSVDSALGTVAIAVKDDKIMMGS